MKLGIQTGFDDLDDIIVGLRGGQFVVLGSRPSMGRTTLALSICQHVAFDLGRTVLFVSMQQPIMDLLMIVLASRSRVDLYKFRMGRGLGQQEMVQLGKAYHEIHQGPLFIDSAPCRDVTRIASDARRLKHREDLALIVVDEIQLLELEPPRGPRHEQVAAACRQLKQLAMELDVPVIALSQLKRNEHSEDRRPWITDLLGSRAIEQEADVVMLLHRPEYFDAEDKPGIAELRLARNRDDLSYMVELAYRKNIGRYENLAKPIIPHQG